jgi:hypothetical protein
LFNNKAQVFIRVSVLMPSKNKLSLHHRHFVAGIFYRQPASHACGTPTQGHEEVGGILFSPGGEHIFCW